LPAGRELASASEPISPPFGGITDHHDYELACFWASRVDDRMFWLDVMEGRQEDPAGETTRKWGEAGLSRCGFCATSNRALPVVPVFGGDTLTLPRQFACRSVLAQKS
jgi:hypothetical protein